MKKEKYTENKSSKQIEEQDNLIKEFLSEEELADLLKEGFNKEQIACVAKNNKDKAKIPYILSLISEILGWIIPIK